VAKDDKLKEQLAESRHNERMVWLGATCAFGALSAALAYGAWQNWGPPFIGMMAILIVGFGAIFWVATPHMRQRRKDKIEQLGNPAKKPVLDNSAEELTLKDIVTEIKKSREDNTKNTIATSITILGVSFAIAGLLLILQSGVQIHLGWIGWMLFIFGAVIAVCTLLFSFRKNK
jgi:predicted MFS family arabinose efflux permease